MQNNYRLRFVKYRELKCKGLKEVGGEYQIYTNVSGKCKD